MDCRVSVGLVLGQQWTMSNQQEWYCGSSGLKGICQTGTGSLGNSDVHKDWYWGRRVL